MNAILSKAEREAIDAADVFEDVGAIRAIAPSLFATSPHPKMSGKYAFTNTYDILLHMHQHGYKVTRVMGGAGDYRKVMVRMRSRHQQYDTRAPELVVLDSHDGSSALRMVLGFIEFVCMNGCIAGNKFYDKRYYHRAPDLMEQIMLELSDIGEHVARMDERINRYTVYRTSVGERIQLANAGVRTRWGKDIDEGELANYRRMMLRPRRNEDDDDSLYKVMNVVQENILRGGMSYATNQTIQRVRPIADVSRNMHINQALWDEADKILLAA